MVPFNDLWLSLWCSVFYQCRTPFNGKARLISLLANILLNRPAAYHQPALSSLTVSLRTWEISGSEDGNWFWHFWGYGVCLFSLMTLWGTAIYPALELRGCGFDVHRMLIFYLYCTLLASYFSYSFNCDATQRRHC